MAHSERQELRGAVLEGRYRLAAPLGIGGTAVVFAAERVADGTPVVVKVLRPSFAFHGELRQRLRREGEVARRVPHPGLVRFVDQGWVDDGSPFLVLERLHGECMARLLRRYGPLSVPLVAAIGVRVARILHAVHVHGYVHRDIKPEHVILDRGPDGRLDVRLLDFGVCASEGASQAERDAERGRVYGTPSYVSPEQAAGRPDVDGRTDLYGLATFLFEALTGRVPFHGAGVSQVLKQIIQEDPPPVRSVRSDVDPRMDRVVARAHARIPHRRYPTARALGAALEPLVGDRVATERSLASLVRRRGVSPTDQQPTLPAESGRSRFQAA